MALKRVDLYRSDMLLRKVIAMRIAPRIDRMILQGVANIWLRRRHGKRDPGTKDQSI